jgi:hypothetical protein
VTSFGIVFEVFTLYFLDDKLVLSAVFRDGLSLAMQSDMIFTKFLSSKSLLVTSYGQGFAEYLKANRNTVLIKTVAELF